jgi:tRNA A37 methylthiotransferase MiaB
MMKKLYIETFGCQMNVYDSARMADLPVYRGSASEPSGLLRVWNAETR